MTATSHVPVAMVGIGCRFPGGVTGPESFWRLVTEGVDAITAIPLDRFDAARYFHETPATPGRLLGPWGGFVDQPLEEFDASFFGIARTYAERLDPQQRLLLETAWEAMEDAGMDLDATGAAETGVFVGQWTSDFEHRLFADESAIDFPATLGSGRYAAAGRLSFAFGFRGPSLSVDAACSSGLVAVHLAVQSLRRGECGAALAGGVNVILEPHIHIGYSQGQMLSRDGRCKFGDASADGYVRSEGAGVVVLKRLPDALAHGDRIYAVIRGSATNNDGDSSGVMGRPSRIGQEELLRSALRDAGVRGDQLAYVEAHGTGTRAGDPVELDVLAKVVSTARAPDAPRLWVGSVKTNFGHTEAAAGVAGLIKTSLMLRHGMIPPSLHFCEPTPEVDWAGVPLAIPTTLMPWPARHGERGGERFAGVSAFGIAGANAHVVLQSAPSVQDGPPVAVNALDTKVRDHAGTAHDGTVVLPLSARSDAALRALAGRYAELLAAPGAPGLLDLCWSAATRRTALTHRAAFVAADRATLVASLAAFAAGDVATASGVVHARVPRRVAVVAPGQGAQWVGMARTFATAVPAFRAALMQCDAALVAHASWSLVEQIFLDADATGYLGDRIEVIQPTLVALAIAYAAWLRSVGIEPDAVVGHSLGEVAAAAIAGAITVPDAMRTIVTRSALMQRTSGQGSMAIVELSHEAAVARLAAYASPVTVAVSNSPRSCVISGTPAAVTRVLADLERDGVFCRQVKVDVASHSPQMAPLARELVRALDGLDAKGGTTPVYSTVLAERVDGSAFDAAYWGRNLVQMVRFGDTVRRMLDDGIGAFIELGPHPVLTQSVMQVAEAAGLDVMAVACGRREVLESDAGQGVVAALWASGAAVNWSRVMTGDHRVVALPHYPWQRERYWADAARLRGPDEGAVRRHSLTEEARRTLHTFEWAPVPFAAGPDAATRRWLVVGESGPDAAALAAALRARGSEATVVPSMREAGLMALHDGSGSPIGVVVLPIDDEATAFAPVAGLQALQQALQPAKARSGRDRSAPATTRIWWVTQGAHALAGYAPSPHCAQRAALWGAARVVAEEQAAWWGGLVDLDATESVESQATVLAAHLTATSQEDQVALHDGERRALRLVPVGAAASGHFAWRADAAYLLTGGLGGVSLHLAKAMVQGGARRLILLGRTPLPPRATWDALESTSTDAQRAAAVRALEHLGASVHLMQADVADEAAVRLAVASYEAEGWPRIAGVIHNAAVLENRLSHEMRLDQFRRVLEPKLSGAEVLDRVFPDVDLFVLSSSISAYWAPPGMANYAAANAGCDALAAARRARGVHAISIQWCALEGVGMADARDTRRNVEEMSNYGVHAISVDDGMALFQAALTRPESVLALLPIDWSTFRDARRGRHLPLYLAIAEAAAAPGAGTRSGEMLQALLSASGVERRLQLEALVRRIVAGVLRRPAASIDAHQSFGSLGVDSLMALEIRNRLEVALEQSLSATLAWNYPNIELLRDHLDGLLAPPATATRTAADSAPSTAGAPELARRLDDIASLSEDDALRALRKAR